MRAVAIGIVLVAIAGCSNGSTAPLAGPAHASPSTGTPSVAAACSNATVIASWPLAQRAAAVVVVPVLDFDVAGVTNELRAGAGGLLFLGSAAAPADLAGRLRSVHALVMADEEGGGIQRLAPLVGDFPWPRDMTRSMTPAQVQSLGARVGRQMRAAGVTVDLAPVLDVDNRPGPSASNPDGARSFSGDPPTVASYGVAFMRGLEAAGVTAVVKHFPGLGGSVGNTDVKPATTHEQLEPFRAAIAAGAPAVMVANAAVSGVTPLPATLSHAVITGMLRGQLGFTGLIVTDSLSAGAVQHATSSLAEAVVRSLVAGADLVLFGSTLTAAQTEALQPAAVQRTFDSLIAAVVAGVRDGQLSTARLDAAVGAVVAAQHRSLCR